MFKGRFCSILPKGQLLAPKTANKNCQLVICAKRFNQLASKPLPTPAETQIAEKNGNVLPKETPSSPQTEPFKAFLDDPVKLIVIPITKDKIFLYYKHSDILLNSNSKIVKYETKLSQKAAQIWNKLETSPKSYNKVIVKWVNKFLNQVTWEEHSLTSIPSESFVLKKINENTTIKDFFPDKSRISLEEYMRYSQMEKTKVVEDPEHKYALAKSVEPVKLYYPDSVLSPPEILSKINKLSKFGIAYHKKQMMYCGLALPLTFPLILIPLLPNVPGFYITYRFYCHLKAYLGAKHLKALCNNEHGSWLQFAKLQSYSEIFHCKKDEPFDQLTESQVNKITELLKIPEIKRNLMKAIRQEDTNSKPRAE
ncbi:hypothetical protein ACO0QE_004345 [Hanseniaspora vineae]